MSLLIRQEGIEDVFPEKLAKLVQIGYQTGFARLDADIASHFLDNLVAIWVEQLNRHRSLNHQRAVVNQPQVDEVLDVKG